MINTGHLSWRIIPRGEIKRATEKQIVKKMKIYTAFLEIRILGWISFTSTGVENAITLSLYQPNLNSRYSELFDHFHFLPENSFKLHIEKIIIKLDLIRINNSLG